MKRLPRLVTLAALPFVLPAYAQGLPPGGGSPPGGSTPTLVGDSVTVTQYYPNLSSAGLSSTVTVSSAVEISCPDTTQALCGGAEGLLGGEYIDIGATTISGQFLATFSTTEGATFNGFSFTSLDFGTGYSIVGFTLTTNISNLTANSITYTADSVLINLLGLDPSDTTDGSSIGTFSISLLVSAVPEPAPAATIAAGLMVLAALRRRRAVER